MSSAMDFQIRGSLFTGQFLIPSTPTPNIPTRLTSTALRALPYISLIVGVDALIPTKAVYAIYDPSLASLRFVHGDGTFVNAERVCFRNTFKDGIPNLNRSQRLHFIELMNRSVQYYHAIGVDEGFRATVAREFPTESSIKASLTFMCNIKQGSCPALTDLPPREAPRSSEELQDQAMPCIPLTSSPTWDFSPSGFQAVATQEMEVEFTNLYRSYCSKYHFNILPIDFQHALFCLAGLMKAELIPFVLEGQNNPKYFADGVTPPLPPKLLKPHRTSHDWTVDCFIARFQRFEKMFNGGYERWPDPIAWLEAEMDREEIQNQKVRPWKLVVEKGEKEPKEPPVIDWETLQGLKWQTRGSYSQYPKPLIPQKPQPLELHDIISPNSFRFKESKRAKKDRKEKEKAAKKTVTVDLTGNGTVHMNQPAVRRGFEDIGSGYTGDESDLNSPMPRKRKYNENSRPQFTQHVDSNDEQFPTLEQLQHSHRIKQEKAVPFIPEEDLYGVSDREDERREQQQRKKARYQSPPPKKFKVPPTVDMMMGPRLMEGEDYQLPIRPGFMAGSFKTPSSGLAQTSGGWGARRKHIFTTSSPESDSDIEVISTSNPPRPSPPKSQNKSPTKSSASSSSRETQLKTNMQECLNTFEHQHKIPNAEFDARYYDRLRSPSSSFSPEAQQSLYPSIEISPSLSNNDRSSSNKSSSSRDRMVIDLESPENGYGEISVERGGSSPGGHRFNDRIEYTETASSGTLSSRTVSRDGEASVESRIEAFSIAGEAGPRRNSMCET